jgi:multidrug resistance efflux pump
MIRRGRIALWGLGLVTVLAVAGITVVILWKAGSHGSFASLGESLEIEPPPGMPADTDDPLAGEEGVLHVRTIRPQRNPSFVLKVSEVAYVEAYYQADILSQVQGRVKYIQKDIGDPVTQGEVLIEIDVPDLVQEVALKEATVEQRKREEELTEKKVDIARVAIEVAKADRDLKETVIGQAQATLDLRLKTWQRYQRVAKQDGASALLVEEAERDYWSAKYAADATKVAVTKAEAEWRQAKANLDAAIADVRFKQSLTQAARKDRDRAEAVANYARITAPFDGVITRRTVDPGSFVQNATTGSPEPLLTVARTDVVTVGMKVPDNFAPLVRDNIEAIIQMDQLPGEEIRGKVTRRAPSVQNKDRTMRVEVDLYNDTEQEYLKFERKGLATFLTALASAHPVEAAALSGAARITWWQHKKSMGAFPLFPKIRSESVSHPPPQLLPGMTGYMELRLPCDNAYLLPVGAVFSRGGKSYIAEVKNGTAHLVPVVIQAEDGSMAKVVTIVQRVNPKTSARERVRRELTGNEEIIASGQGEIADGQAVLATLSDWAKPKAGSGDN